MPKPQYPSGGGLNPEQEELLTHLTYDADKDMINADAPITTTLNSFYLGEQHKMSSGAQNIFFTNLTFDIDFYPLWGGLKKQQEVANQDSTGLLQPSARVYGDNLLNEVTDPLDTSKIVDYRAVITVPENISIHGLTVNLKEPLIIGDLLEYSIKSTSHTGNLVYYQKVVVNENRAVGDNFTFWYDHPAELLTGDTVAINLDKNGQVLKVAGVTTSSEPWRTLHLRSFEDKPLILPTINADKLLTNDTSANPGGAFIGRGYTGIQYYGQGAEAQQYYGKNDLAAQYYGNSATGDQYYGYEATGKQYYGYRATGEQTYGQYTTKPQYYGYGAVDNQFYGKNATSGIEIGSTQGTDATKKLISGAGSATFAQIISAGTSSDRRLKENIEPIESALAKVQTLTGCTFDMKLDDGTPERRTGLIAQDVQKVLPEAVMEDDSEDKYLSVVYGSIMGLAVEAIKELSSQVEELKLHNKEQSKNINRLYTLIGEKPPTTKKWYQFWK